MKESGENLWRYYGIPGHRVAISTNGFVKKNGEAVMGRGCAKEARDKWPTLARELGHNIVVCGNIPTYLTPEDLDGPQFKLMILPVKHNWWEPAALELVQKSIDFLDQEAKQWGHSDWVFHVPQLGCGNGKLDWNAIVKPMMILLPDNVFVHHYN